MLYIVYCKRGLTDVWIAQIQFSLRCPAREFLVASSVYSFWNNNSARLIRWNLEYNSTLLVRGAVETGTRILLDNWLEEGTATVQWSAH